MPEPGTVIAGKYRVERTLGTGGMGMVLEAHHLLLDQRIALKCLTPIALEYPDIVERFTREARAAARVRSEHVARVIDVDQFENGLPFIVLEYLDGEDLADHLAHNGPLRVSTAVRFILEACEVLAEAHAAGIVHRDIKPANLFIAKQRDKRRIIKVLDFGISKLTDEPVTQASAMLGTVTYMSPEQLRSAKEVDHRTDIWALGAVLYECLTGKPAFGGSNTAELIASVFSNDRRPMQAVRDDLPVGLVDIVERCLRTDPTERFESVLELATELAPYAKSEDRASVDTIRRVVGVSIAPPSSNDRERRDSSIPSSRGGVFVVHDDAGEVTNTVPFHPDLLIDKPISASSASGMKPISESKAKRPISSSGSLATKASSSSSRSVATKPASSSSRIPVARPSSSSKVAAAKPPSSGTGRAADGSQGGTTTPPVEAPRRDSARAGRLKKDRAPEVEAPVVSRRQATTFAGVTAVIALLGFIGARAMSESSQSAPQPAPPPVAKSAPPPPVTTASATAAPSAAVAAEADASLPTSPPAPAAP